MVTIRKTAASGTARRAADTRGRDAERQVAEFWQARGYEVLARRLRTAAGEIDLIVANDAELIFLEVKCRANRAAAADALRPRQQARLLAAAAAALGLHPDWQRPDTRFDLAVVSAGELTHIEDVIREA